MTNKLTDHHCGNTIQNELICIMAGKVLENISTRLKFAKYYSLILNCTPDISHSEKMSFTLRFVDIVDCQVTVQEDFVGSETVNETTGEGLTETILLYLNKFNISIQDCQGYDNGSNMKGKHNGVQVRVLKMNSRAFFVPCACHSLNLVVADAASSSLKSVSLFGVLQRIYVIFSASVH